MSQPTLADVQTWINNGLAAYATGGPAWQITTGIQVAKDLDAYFDFGTTGKIVYAWIEQATKPSQADSPKTYEKELRLMAVGKVLGDKVDLDVDAAKMIEDLERMLLIGSGAPASVKSTVEFVSHSGPVRADNEVDCAVVAKLIYLRQVT